MRLILCVWYRRDEEDGDVGEGEGGGLVHLLATIGDRTLRSQAAWSSVSSGSSDLVTYKIQSCESPPLPSLRLYNDTTSPFPETPPPPLLPSPPLRRMISFNEKRYNNPHQHHVPSTIIAYPSDHSVLVKFLYHGNSLL